MRCDVAMLQLLCTNCLCFLQYTPEDAEDSCKEIIWFWEVVNKLKEEEKALLLKFSTGSPCLPAGGFAHLQVSTL